MRLIVGIPPVLAFVLLPFILAWWLLRWAIRLTAWLLRRAEIGRLAHTRGGGGQL